MQLNAAMEEALAQVAWRYNAELEVLRMAVQHEAADELARALKLDSDAAQQRMARIQRAATVQTDIGAGCKLLTDDVQAEVLAAIASL